MMAYLLSKLPIIGKKDTTNDSTCKKISESNETKELPKGIFPINLKLLDRYQRKYPILMAKYKNEYTNWVFSWRK